MGPSTKCAAHALNVRRTGSRSRRGAIYDADAYRLVARFGLALILRLRLFARVLLSARRLQFLGGGACAITIGASVSWIAGHCSSPFGRGIYDHLSTPVTQRD